MKISGSNENKMFLPFAFASKNLEKFSPPAGYFFSQFGKDTFREGGTKTYIRKNTKSRNLPISRVFEKSQDSRLENSRFE